MSFIKKKKKDEKPGLKQANRTLSPLKPFLIKPGESFECSKQLTK